MDIRGLEPSTGLTPRQSGDLLRPIINSRLVSVILFDQSLTIRAFNRLADEFCLRLTKKNLRTDTPISEYASGDNLTRFSDHAFQALRGQQNSIESCIDAPDGSQEWFEFHWEPAYSEHDDLNGIIFWTIPITSGKVTEQRIQQLYEGERKQRLIAEALQEASLALGFTLDTDTILDRILEQVAKVLPMDIGRVLLFDDRQVRIARIKGFGEFDRPDVYLLTDYILEVDQMPIIKWILDNDQPLVIPDTHDYPGWENMAGLGFIRSWIGMPIHAYEELIALFSLSKAQANSYHPGHVKQLEAFASQAGLALQNAKLFHMAQHRLKEAETLRLAAAAVTTELDLDHVLERILINLKKVVQFDSASIFLIEDELLRIVAASGFSDDIKIGDTFSAENALFRQSLTTGRPIILGDAAVDNRFEQWTGNEKIHGWLGVPLHLRGRAIGFLTIDSYQVNAYSEAEATLAQAFANQATIALENARLFKELQSLATTDPLTEIWNRRHFIHLAKIEFQRARRFRQPLSVILFDIDSFKIVNDTYGHPVGDQVLRCMAKVCQTNLRRSDLLGRYGGEEFMVLLPDTPLDRAQVIAERLRKQIANTPMITDHGPIHISASFGIAEMDETCLDIDTLLTYADRAAYSAKLEGKNRVAFRQNNDKPNL